jgi:hypothetical protein
MAYVQDTSNGLELAESFNAFDTVVPKLEYSFRKRHIESLDETTSGFEGACDKFNRVLTFHEPAKDSHAFECALEVCTSFDGIKSKIDIAKNALAEFREQITKFTDATLSQPNAFPAGDMLGTPRH